MGSIKAYYMYECTYTPKTPQKPQNDAIYLLVTSFIPSHVILIFKAFSSTLPSPEASSGGFTKRWISISAIWFRVWVNLELILLVEENAILAHLTEIDDWIIRTHTYIHWKAENHLQMYTHLRRRLQFHVDSAINITVEIFEVYRA